MQSSRYAPFLVLLSLLGGCGDDSRRDQAGAPPDTGAESAAPAADAAAASANLEVADSVDAAGLHAGACAACHGTTGEGVGDFPSLAALSREVVHAGPAAYQAGETVGPRSAIMAPIAGQLSDEQSVALAAYLGS
jgi:cytochrome c553